MMLSVYSLRDVQVCTRLLFSSFGRHWYEVALHHVQPLQVLRYQDALQFHWKALECHVVRYRTVKSCPAAQKRSSCESHVKVLQCLRMLEHHLSRMTRTHANWVEMLFMERDKRNQMLLPRESDKALDGWADCGS